MIVRAVFSLTFGAGLILLSACEDFNRFKQEKYECGWNPLGILEIDLRSIEVDTKPNLVTIDGDVTGKLIFSDDQELIIKAPELIIRINREKSLIRATKGTRYHQMQCKKIEFKM